VNLVMGFASRTWWVVDRCDPRARHLVDGTGRWAGIGKHYSRQTPGAIEFMSSGRTLVLLTECGRAVWGAIENREPGGAAVHWRCSMFRNEGAGRSSDLIREATALTFEWWRRHYGGLPPAPLRTEVDARRVRRKRDPGRCFRRSGWIVVPPTEVPRATKHGLVILEAPANEGQ
jgi:hypothetical protein